MLDGDDEEQAIVGTATPRGRAYLNSVPRPSTPPPPEWAYATTTGAGKERQGTRSRPPVVVCLLRQVFVDKILNSAMVTRCASIQGLDFLRE